MPARNVTFSIFRHNPYDPASEMRMQDFVLDETPRMTLFTALNRIREEQDPSLQFDFVCRAGVCGTCGILVNGKPGLACHTMTQSLPAKITLMPLPFFKLVGDLSVDTGTWFAEMGKRVESWIHPTEAFDPEAEEQRMTNEEAQEIYELDRCIECGCCIASCGTALMREDFVGAAGMLRIARFMIDPRDGRSDQDIFEVVGNETGTFGCVGLLACDDNCPKHLPLATQLAFIRRRMLMAGLKGDVARAASDGHR